MSHAPQDQETLDFWEFVSCSKCRMPFALDNGSATVPFWLTECGHVVCNNHLNSDQSCSQCGAQGIQLTPLHREMEAPMSEWFQCVPLAIESVAHAAKFQQEAMASQLRYHRSRHQQLRQVLERLKRETTELKRINDALRRENSQYRAQAGYSTTNGASDFLNENGKREMVPMQQREHDNRRPRTDSSPRSIATPLGPNRLTLQPGQPLHEMSAQKQHELRQSASNRPQDQYLQERPVSRLEKYAYVPQETNTFHPPQLSHAQAAPRFFQLADQPRNDNVQQNQRTNTATNLPPPSSSRFKPPTNLKLPANHTSIDLPVPRQTKMGPPPTPNHFRKEGPTISNMASGQRVTQHAQANGHHLPPPQPNRRPFAIPSTPIPGQHSNATPRQFFQTARGSSRPSVSTGGQRTPFFSHDG